MKPIDAIGNVIEKGDLVIQSDENGSNFFCIVAEIKEPSELAVSGMEMAGYISMIPTPITAIFTAKEPRIKTIAKVVKPAGFGKPAS
jgi:hypothetical protein